LAHRKAGNAQITGYFSIKDLIVVSTIKKRDFPLKGGTVDSYEYLNRTMMSYCRVTVPFNSFQAVQHTFVKK